MRDTRKNSTRLAEREWEVRFNGSRIQITNGLIELRDWGSYRHEYPKNERQLRRGLDKARKVIEDQRSADQRGRDLREFAVRHGWIDA